jgi:hypothetical protein
MSGLDSLHVPADNADDLTTQFLEAAALAIAAISAFPVPRQDRLPKRTCGQPLIARWLAQL